VRNTRNAVRTGSAADRSVFTAYGTARPHRDPMSVIAADARQPHQEGEVVANRAE
jgi:hypothetical protein